jgi:Zn-dependent protease with chaperone function
MNALLISLVATIGFGALSALALAWVYPRQRERLAAMPGAQRSRMLLALLALPPVLGLGLALTALLPGALGTFIPALDHCTHHHDNHLHLCFMHGPEGMNYLLAGTLVLLGAAPLARRAYATARGLRRAREVLESLERGSSSDASRTHAIVDSAAFLAITAGLWRPRIYVTSALLEELDGPSRAAMLAHEEAHRRGRDPLRKLIAELLRAFHLPGTGCRLVADFGLALEEACDDFAAREVGDRTAVAAALVATGRLMNSASHGPLLWGAAFGEASLDQRVRSLLGSAKADRPTPTLRATVGSAVVALCILAIPLHHLTETLFGHLLR